jgi:hypothetical protein
VAVVVVVVMVVVGGSHFLCLLACLGCLQERWWHSDCNYFSPRLSPHLQGLLLLPTTHVALLRAFWQMGSLLTASSKGPLPAQAPEELNHLK